MPNDVEMDGLLPQIKKKLHRIAQLADSIVLQRYQLEHEQQTQDSCQTFVEESATDLIRSMDTALAEGNLHLRRQHIADTQSQLRNDIAALKLQYARVKELRTVLSLAESRLKTRAEKLAKTIDGAIVPSGQPLYALSEAASMANTSSAASSLHSQTPSLLAAYYDKKGDIGVFRERLLELEDHYRESRLQRDLIIDRGDDPATTTQQFEAEFGLQRQAILTELTRAEEGAVALQQQCKDAGLQLRDPQRTSSSSEIPSEKHAIIETGTQDTGALHTLETPAVLRTTTNPQKQTRIRDWIETLNHFDRQPLVVDTAFHDLDQRCSQRNSRTSRRRKSFPQHCPHSEPSNATRAHKRDNKISQRRRMTDPELPRSSTAESPGRRDALPILATAAVPRSWWSRLLPFPFGRADQLS